jgi:hypothetical protein
MSAEQVITETNWGPPDHVNRTVTATGEQEQWVYKGGYLYFEGTRNFQPPCLLRSLPAGAVAGQGLHPLETRRLVTAHVETGPSASPGLDRLLTLFRTIVVRARPLGQHRRRQGLGGPVLAQSVDLLRTPRHRPSNPRGNCACSRSVAATGPRQGSCITGQPRAPDHAPDPTVAPCPHPNLGGLRVGDPPGRRGLWGRRRRDRAHPPASLAGGFV